MDGDTGWTSRCCLRSATTRCGEVRHQTIWTATLAGRADVVFVLLQHDAKRYDTRRYGTLLKAAVTRGHRGVADALMDDDRERAKCGHRVDGECALHPRDEREICGAAVETWLQRERRQFDAGNPVAYGNEEWQS